MLWIAEEGCLPPIDDVHSGRGYIVQGHRSAKVCALATLMLITLAAAVLACIAGTPPAFAALTAETRETAPTDTPPAVPTLTLAGHTNTNLPTTEWTLPDGVTAWAIVLEWSRNPSLGPDGAFVSSDGDSQTNGDEVSWTGWPRPLHPGKTYIHAGMLTEGQEWPLAWSNVLEISVPDTPAPRLKVLSVGWEHTKRHPAWMRVRYRVTDRSRGDLQVWVTERMYYWGHTSGPQLVRPLKWGTAVKSPIHWDRATRTYVLKYDLAKRFEYLCPYRVTIRVRDLEYNWSRPSSAVKVFPAY
jgi:hypothetical protein